MDCSAFYDKNQIKIEIAAIKTTENNIFEVEPSRDNSLILNTSQIHAVTLLIFKWRILRSIHAAWRELKRPTLIVGMAINLKRRIGTTTERAYRTLKQTSRGIEIYRVLRGQIG